MCFDGRGQRFPFLRDSFPVPRFFPSNLNGFYVERADVITEALRGVKNGRNYG